MILLNSRTFFAFAVSRTEFYIHWRSEFFAREERIQWNYSCATIRISRRQFLAKYFAVVGSGLKFPRENPGINKLLITDIDRCLVRLNFRNAAKHILVNLGMKTLEFKVFKKNEEMVSDI